MPVEQADMLIGDALMQMHDGIHPTTRFMHVASGKVTHEHISSLKNRLHEKLVSISRDLFLDMLEEYGADFTDMEKAYGEYNAFARVPEQDEYFAWYDNCR